MLNMAKFKLVYAIQVPQGVLRALRSDVNASAFAIKCFIFG